LTLRDASSSSQLFKPDSVIKNAKTGLPAGKLINIIEQTGIAMMRLANVSKEDLVILDNNQKEHKLITHVPPYWIVNDVLKTQLENTQLL
jgi:hypothetical protein